MSPLLYEVDTWIYYKNQICLVKPPQFLVPRIWLLTKADDTYKSLIWSVAESSMTMVATSIPVLRVFFQRTIKSVTGQSSQYNSSNQYSQSCSRKGCSNFAKSSSGLSSKCLDCSRTPRPSNSGSAHLTKTGAVDCISEEELMAENESRRERNIEMDNLVIEDGRGRASARTPESFPSPEGNQKMEPWPLQ